MIQRIVKMAFQEGRADEFLSEILPLQKQYTRDFEGCGHLELWRDIHDNDVIISYSLWQSEDHLNTYRNSDKFKRFWATCKTMFKEPAQAWSVEMVEQVFSNKNIEEG